MPFVRHGNGGHTSARSLYRTMSVWATLAQAATAMAQGGIIPSQPPQGLIPSQPPQGIIPSQPPQGIIPSQPPQGIIPSQPPQGIIPSQPPPGIIPSQPPPGIIPSQPPPEIIHTSPPSSLIPSAPGPPGLIPSQPVPTLSGAESIPDLIPTKGPDSSGTHVVAPTTASMRSTDDWLRPIPPAETNPGNPNGHHEVSEPNFTKTGPCKGCSPIIEIPATGFFDWPSTPIPEHAGTPTTRKSNKATITAGPTQVIIGKDPSSSGGFVIGDSTTVTPGQTVIVDNTPIVIRTSSGSTAIIIGGTATVPFTPDAPQVPQSQITEGPILAPVTIGDKVVTANSKSQYIIGGETLQPGGPAITVDGTTLSLSPSASAIVVNGVTRTLAQIYGAVFTTTALPFLTLNNEVYTANRAGYYILGPGTTLIPGGSPVTVSGTVVSLEPHGTYAVIQGSTSTMDPVTTLVTLTRGGGLGGDSDGGGLGGGSTWTPDGGLALPDPTGAENIGHALGISATISACRWIEGTFILASFALGWLAIWL